ncbi:Kinesin-like protein kin-10b [Thalictrum thalictroides]|uniref:Kinesin-like protein KIF22 n=1 Tax=Thalictrum thalictroides TaxID=46969 RepID=A0A7J6V517_THATH|nr:Kinesin-like protein kin-10b [Thalictrum thalictroides]
MEISSVTSTPKITSKHSQLKNLISKVRVVVRVRPFLPTEISETSGNPSSCVSLLNLENGSADEVAVHLKDQFTSRKECYKLDSYYGEENSVKQIFQKEVSPLISWMFCGCNGTIFAYGATGSGKTHTMQGTDELPGLMPLSMSMVLELCEISGSIAEISYYEVYMDRCYDLLEPKAQEIAVLDDKDGQVHLKGLSQVPVSSMPEFQQVLSSGIQRRKVAHTGLNDVSSRSHGVLVIVVSTPSSNGSGNFITGKLNLIDLAGNEDNRRTGNEGIRLQESAKINQSLFALSNVICALNNNKSRVPYRESKLTRILQDSLGGNSHSLMVACLNPGVYQESVNTVSLASRSRQITNYISSAQKEETPTVKIDMEAKLQAWLESKGKSKTTQRIGGVGSPLPSKTPLCTTRSIKKQSSCHASAKMKDSTFDQDLAARRNLFNSGAQVESFMEMPGCESFHSDSSKTCAEPLSDQVVPIYNVKEYKDHQHDTREDYTGTTNHEDSRDRVSPPCEEDMATTGTANMPEMKDSLPGDLLKPEKSACSPSNKSGGSAAINETIRALQNSLRKVLSPINNNSNIKPFEDITSKNPICMVFFDPKTPKEANVLTCHADGSQGTNTPLDRYNIRSSNLKSSLVQEYLDFLNSASKEELLNIKGIGNKRADHIVQLRETTPLKSLYDLEKIGLSSKQVNDMFRKAARDSETEGIEVSLVSCKGSQCIHGLSIYHPEAREHISQETPITCVSVLNSESSCRQEILIRLQDQITSRNECYEVDSFFGQESSVSEIFQKEVNPLISWVFNGFNATVSAYGATSSGKTYTMQGTDELPGLIPMSMSMVLEMCEKSASIAELSYYEVYMDRCYDLLEPKGQEISLLEDKDGLHLKGLSRVQVSSMSAFHQVFQGGIHRRKVAHTRHNEVSSRSHGVLVIVVSSPCSNGSGSVVTGKLNLIDVAAFHCVKNPFFKSASEDNRKTGNEGIRLQESAKINKSLFALSNVVYALNNGKSRVPYRESKLTRILQDSLGGTSRSLMVACLSPGEYQESVNTVSLAARSRHITNYVSSAQKEDTPKMKLSMEAKRCTWLDPIGKMRSTLREGGISSPSFSKTPLSTATKRKETSSHSYTKVKSTSNRVLTNANRRIGTPSFSKTPLSTTAKRKQGSCQSHAKVVSTIYQGLATASSRILFNHEAPVESSLEAMHLHNVEESKDCLNVKQEDAPNASLSAKLLNKDNSACTSSPTYSEKSRALQSASRKVLSPINNNSSTKSNEDVTSKNLTCVADPKTPKTPYILNRNSDGLHAAGSPMEPITPFDKYSARSSHLKNSLVQEYLAFLNSASKEELLKLNGIGQKRAENILQLRETSQLKTLHDVEMIGLSSKQVDDLFWRAARETSAKQ